MLFVLALSGCRSGSPASDGQFAALPAVPRWPMYQHAPDHNAVFTRSNFRRRWSFDTKAKINGGLAVVDDTVYVDTFGKEVLALDIRTGKPLWRTGNLKNIVMSTPVVAEGLVFVGTGGNETLNFGWNPLTHLQYHNKEVWGVPGGDEVVALDAKSGRIRWRFPTLGEDMPSPAYGDGRLYFANGDRHVYALRAATGEQIWRQEIDGIATMASATLVDGRVYVSACANGIRNTSTIALNASNGSIVWQAPYGHCDASPTFAQGKLFVENVQGGAQKYVGRNIVAALDARTGKPAWRYDSTDTGVWTTLGSDESAIAGTYSAGTFYQPAPLSDQIIAFDATTGAVRWRFRTSGPVKMSPLVRRNHLYVGDTTGVFYEINTVNGRLIRATPFKKPFSTSPPVIVGETMLLANDTAVYAVEMNPE
jgi:outer membrane protein assembly factor BamB